MKLKWFGIYAIISLILGIVFAEPFYLLIKSLLPSGVKFIAVNPFDGFVTLMWCGLSISITLFLLGAIFLLWKEFNSALYVKEKEFIFKSLSPAIVLFSIGNAFGIFLYTQIMLPFFIETNNYMGLENYWNLSQVVISGLSLSLMLGLSFLFPLVLRGLIKLGYLNTGMLKAKRGMVLVGILIVSAIITPTPDVLSQVIVGIPLYILFELSMWGLK